MTASTKSAAACALAAGLVVTLAGCGSSSGGSLSQGGSGGSGVSGVSASGSVGTVSVSPSSTAATGKPPGGGMVTSPPGPPNVSHSKVIQVKGLLVRGAEPSCLVLKTTRGTFDLQGPVAQRLQPDHMIVLLGRVAAGVASHCMDGTPFEVTAIATR